MDEERYYICKISFLTKLKFSFIFHILQNLYKLLCFYLHYFVILSPFFSLARWTIMH